MYNRKDSYYHKAKKEGYKSRAAYKLMELNQKFRLIKNGSRVLDCGAAPGGWSQVALEIIGKNGHVVAVDYAPISGINNDNFTFIQGDMYSEDIITQVLSLAHDGYDTVLSDMAPKTTGIKVKDHTDSIALASLALNMAHKTLKNNGSFIVKVFDGDERESYLKELKANFTQVRALRPDSTRKSSYEMYLIATGYKKQIEQLEK